MIDPKKNNNNDIKNAIDGREVQDVESSYIDSDNSSNNNEDMKQKLRKLMLITVLCVVILIILLLFFSLLFPKKRGYSDVEVIMKNAAIKYYNSNKNELPSKNGSVVEVSAQKLANNGYMKDLSKYGKDTCTGKVVVYNNDDDYLYTPYLDCGDSYKTVELFSKVTDSKNVVTSGNGLYYINGEYVFRGDEVNNYVKIDENLYRIVKIDANNEVVLILNSSAGISYTWDNRYNSEKRYKAGINNYDLSRIKSRLRDIYNSNEVTNDYELNVGILNKSSRSLVVDYNLCTAPRAKDTTVKDNSLECLNITRSKIGLLTLSDYANASLDTNCDIVTKKSCQNYNYLVNKDIGGWWLMTPSSDDSSSVYFINQSGYVEITDASNSKSLRPVIHLNSKTMYKSGKGTLKNPYTLKY